MEIAPHLTHKKKKTAHGNTFHDKEKMYNLSYLSLDS